MDRSAAGAPVSLTEHLSLRIALDQDRAQLFDWHRQAFGAHIQQIWGWDADWQRKDFARLLDHVPTFVVMDNARGIGYLQLLHASQALHVVNIALIECARGQGVGSQLLGWLKQRALESGRALELGVFVTNARARVFYERHGLVCTQTTDSHWRMRWAPGAR